MIMPSRITIPGGRGSAAQQKTLSKVYGSKSMGTKGYSSVLSTMVEALKPGGTVEKLRLSEAAKAGKQLGARIQAGNVARGLGNVSMGTERTVADYVSGIEGQIKSDTLSQYIQSLQFIAGLEAQERGQEMQFASNAASRPSMASMGLTATGRPLHGAGSMMALGSLGGGGSMMMPTVSTVQKPSAGAFPSLYASAGGGAYPEAPSLFGGTQETKPAPIMFGTPMMGSSDRWRKDTKMGSLSI